MNDIRKKVLVIRPTTTTREPILITISQRETPSGELALATAILSGHLPVYFEKPDLLRDLGTSLIVAAFFMEEFNQYVKR